MNDISVIVVSWNAKNYLRQCIASVLSSARECVHEVIVVDNASSDGSADMVAQEFPEVRLMRMDENLGFAKANNVAMQQATGRFFALVNSDVVVHPECLHRLREFMLVQPQFGLVGPQIVGADKRVQQNCRRLPTPWNNFCRALGLDLLLPNVPLFSGHEMRHFKHDVQLEVEVIGGCFWVARAEAVQQVGLLDERYFFYMEDVDWCRRFAHHGWRLGFLPKASATHFGGASSSNAPLHYSLQYHRAGLAYWYKHHGHLGKLTYWGLAIVHHGLRLVIRAVKHLVRQGVSATSVHKIQEDVVCLRWLLTGKGL